ncbi:MAG: adenosine deaminase [Acidimicrobiia bacterium]
MEGFLAALPKVELHLHLEGSLRPQTMFRLAEANGVDLDVETPEDLQARYEFESFDDFLRLFLTGLDVIRTGENFVDMTVALAAELSEQNVRYAEVTTTPYNHHRRGIPMADYVEGLNEGRRRAQVEHGVGLGWVCDIPRELEPSDLGFTADLVTGSHGPHGVVALGLGGPEPGFPPERFVDSFHRAKAAGLGSVPHAGETEGPASVWGAVKTLRADRIGHGIRSLEDPKLIDHLINESIPLEVSMSSNVALNLVADIAAHPLPELLSRGVPVCLNTDDPAYFGTDLNSELRLAHEIHGLDEAALVDLQSTAVRHSFASDELKTSMSAELEALDV